MSAAPEVIIAASSDALAADTATRTIAALAAAITARSVAHLVVTGGGILESVLAALPAAQDEHPIDWQRVHVWWGDERYVPSDSGDRNDLPALAKAFDHLPVDRVKLHPMPASDAGFGDDLDAAADSYAAELAACVPTELDGEDVPRFDVVLLGLGPDGHCASLFPEAPGVYELDASVIGVRNSPKPPPNRLSLTFPSLDSANEVWFIASGAGKAHAVGLALSGTPREKVPSAGPRGRLRTLWLIDEDAAAEVPNRS